MKIETFQKIQQRLIDVTLLPVSFFIAITIYFWQSLWDQNLFLTMVAFVASSASCVYFLSINISTKPWAFLKQTYLNNKKYKELRKIQQTQSNANPKETVTSTTQQPQKQIAVQERTSEHKQGHFQFHLEDQKIIQKPSKLLSQAQKQKNQRGFVSLKEKDEQKIQTFVKGPSNFLNQLDPLEMFFYSSKQNGAQKDSKLHQKVNFDRFGKFEQDLQFERESKHVKKCIQNFTKAVESEDLDRKQYEKRFKSYMESLQAFQLNFQGMQRLVDETKLIVRQKIEQNLKRQFENLDNIESTIRKNFNVNFKSYKQRSDPRVGSNTFYGQNLMSANKNITSAQLSADSKKGYLVRNQSLTFTGVLQQCVNLLRNHYFNFQYIGESQRIDDVKSELKKLITQRILLDQYLFLKRPLRVGRLEGEGREIAGVNSEFQEERYFGLMKLRSLAQIIGERKIAQENLLKEFFSTHRTFLSHSNEPIDQINDQRNIQFVMRFMIRTFQEKLTTANASDYIQIRMTEPNFEDSKINFIWVTKALGLKSHYDIQYSCHAKDEKQGRMEKAEQKQKKKRVRTKLITCCPGQNNIWVCFAFMRQIIAKIGLRKQNYPMIKDKTLRKDFQRLIELLK